MTADADATADFVTPEQLCIGLHVHLDLPWTAHPFTFASFKIRSLEQVATLQSLGLARIRYTPAKSDCEPLAQTTPGDDAAVAADAADGPAFAPLPPAADPAYDAKRRRMARLAAQRERVAACEQQFVSSARLVKAINQNLFARPEEARAQAGELVSGIAGSMLSDAEVAVNLMKEKAGGEDTYHHALNVTVLAMMLAKELKATPEALRMLGMAAMFHDVGKHDIPERVLRKTEPLTRPELALVQQHGALGVEIGRKLGLPAEALTAIAQHHERMDGRGYPGQLAGAAITPLARMLAVANVFDNLCNPLDVARAMTPHEALSCMYGQQRAHFDATVMSTFIRCMGVYPPGTVVVLSNDALAIVVAVNGARPLKPTVLIHDPTVPRDEAILVDLEQEPEVTIARTLRPQQLPPEVHGYLSPRSRLSYFVDAAPGTGPG